MTGRLCRAGAHELVAIRVLVGREIALAAISAEFPVERGDQFADAQS